MKKLIRILTISSFFLGLTIFSHNLFAYFEVLNTANVVEDGTLRATATSQFLLDRYEGVEISGLADIGWSDQSDIRLTFGVGAVDFAFGGYYKWAPVPDRKGQPAMALISGVSYGNINGSNEFRVVTTPIISKKIATKKQGSFVYFVAMPIGMMSRSGEADFPVNLALGSEWFPVNFKWDNAHFIAELNLHVNDSFTSISIGISFDIDDIPYFNVTKDPKRIKLD